MVDAVDEDKNSNKGLARWSVVGGGRVGVEILFLGLLQDN